MMSNSEEIFSKMFGILYTIHSFIPKKKKMYKLPTLCQALNKVLGIQQQMRVN